MPTMSTREFNSKPLPRRCAVQLWFARVCLLALLSPPRSEPVSILLGDFDANGVADFDDFFVFVDQFGKKSSD